MLPLDRDGVAARVAGFPRVAADLPELKQAAVAVCVTQREQTPALLLTRRAAQLRTHAGQWALPGGRRDDGETAVHGALRELTEEVGLSLDDTQILGILDDYVTRSGYVMTPVVCSAGPVRRADWRHGRGRAGTSDTADRPGRGAEVHLDPGIRCSGHPAAVARRLLACTHRSDRPPVLPHRLPRRRRARRPLRAASLRLALAAKLTAGIVRTPRPHQRDTLRRHNRTGPPKPDPAQRRQTESCCMACRRRGRRSYTPLSCALHLRQYGELLNFATYSPENMSCNGRVGQ